MILRGRGFAMIVFELTMPNINTWNNHWSGETKRFIRLRQNNCVPDDLIDNDYYYNFSDGWTACISVTKMSATEAHKLEKKAKGFCGYDWMITSIIKYGDIRTEQEGIDNG